MTELVHWYNEKHRHSAIRFVTSAQRHAHADEALIQARAAMYEKARQKQPQRWSRRIHNWTFIDTVHINPDSAQPKEAEAGQKAA